MMMNWYSWLSKTSLEPSLVYEYGLTFVCNELHKDDIAHFNHDFLQGMGISVAKHRLQILKLAQQEIRSPGPHHSLSGLVYRTKRCFTKCIQRLVVAKGKVETYKRPKVMSGPIDNGRSTMLTNGKGTTTRTATTRGHSGPLRLLSVPFDGRKSPMFYTACSNNSSSIISSVPLADTDTADDYADRFQFHSIWATMFHDDMKPT